MARFERSGVMADWTLAEMMCLHRFSAFLKLAGEVRTGISAYLVQQQRKW